TTTTLQNKQAVFLYILYTTECTENKQNKGHNMTKNYTTSTRTFSFPNSGHSVRKLISSLEDMDPNTPVAQHIEYHSDDDIDFSFVQTNNSKLTVSHLLRILPRLGTRFTVIDEKLEFYHDFSDIQHHPEIYCI
ncbi:MAG: hypothetical protein U9N34_01560, partial [Candidatus Cloacimonadota bacterium]|nr:hypothetical protein [Candidatus Cloacimonadota bacterium]